ncbi:MAG TPA: hypothetical protein VGV37_06275 [Aliidongia sp.]|uniref:hypothetical protein n=1 Tax=Aliidongia sp. TaxID=1914230 RepID=UPI002DDCAEB8|nr:hypothetical protein [Aliidongia sp.]HEV2674131.1 hypothetical protein [Aliidongia sp.]
MVHALDMRTEDLLKMLKACYGKDRVEVEISACDDESAQTIRALTQSLTSLRAVLAAEKTICAQRQAIVMDLSGRLNAMAADMDKLKAEKDALVRELADIKPREPAPPKDNPFARRHDGRGGI